MSAATTGSRAIPKPTRLRYMYTSLDRQLSAREPHNALFDRACDLLDAAGAIRSAAGAPPAAPAAPAVLGCIEAALRELVQATTALEQASAQAIETRSKGRAKPESDATVSRMHRGYDNLNQALADAERASGAARALAARALATSHR
jgi:hypothetical protein